MLYNMKSEETKTTYSTPVVFPPEKKEYERTRYSFDGGKTWVT